MKIAIVGYDVEGKSSYNYFVAQGHDICIRDQNPTVQVPAGVPAILGDDYLNGLDQFDLIVRTAGLPPSKILAKNPDVADKITTHLDEFMRVCPTLNTIGVTGTKGKGTTSTLITKILETTGKEVKLGGNIGVAPLTFLDELDQNSWVVLELSSFQLIDLKSSPHISICLMIAPEHLNWHASMDEYTQAKSQLFMHQVQGDKAIYFAGDQASKHIALNGQGEKIPYFASPGAYINEDRITIENHTICETTDLRLIGSHNWQNACAAVTAVWQAGVQDIEAIRQVLTSFTGLPHRLEMIHELDGVHYYDDSFGTTPETAMVAIQSFTNPEIVILGGRSKGIPFTELARFVTNAPNIKKVITIGETRTEIAAELKQLGFHDIVDGGTDIISIVKKARELAESGDIVLFSTGCASFDMFKNYKDRGEQFTQAVRSLA